MPRNSGKPSLTSRIKAFLCGGPEYGDPCIDNWQPRKWRVFPYYPPWVFHGPCRDATRVETPNEAWEFETWLCKDYLTRTQFRYVFRWDGDLDERDSYYTLIEDWVNSGG